jgi:anti-sigma regulatory factor (Ser/Thr protein kinase)
MVAHDPVRSILQNVVVSFGQSLELHTAPEAFLARLNQADVVVIDITSPACRSCLSQIQMANDHRPVIVLASLNQRAESLEAQRLGAFAVIPALATEEELTFHIGHALTTLAERFDPRKLEFQERTVCIGNDFGLVTPVALSVVDTALPPGDPRKTTVALGLVEVITNAIEHGNLGINYDQKREALRGSVFYNLASERAGLSPWKDRIVRIRSTVDTTNSIVRFTIEDQGDGFDWRNLPNPTDPLNINARHGRGILMASHAFTSMTYNDKGNAVTLELALDESFLEEQ